MHLVVFDIDGTLTDTNAVDERVFLKTFEKLYGLTGLSSNWLAYKESTDSGIAAEIIASRLGRSYTDQDFAEIQNTFSDFLRDEPDTCFKEVPGASKILESLRSESNTFVSIATGAWKKSALTKLSRAGIDIGGIEAAFANDAHRRADIIQTSIRRAEDRAGTRFDKITYVGDGLWDFRASRELGIRFVGRHSDGQALKNEGAEIILKDYRGFADILTMLKSL